METPRLVFSLLCAICSASDRIVSHSRLGRRNTSALAW